MEHYKSGIRVSHGGEWPAAGIKMTSGLARTHVLPPNEQAGIEQRDRRCWGKAERASVHTEFSTGTQHHIRTRCVIARTRNVRWKFLQFRCNPGLSILLVRGARTCVTREHTCAAGNACNRVRAFILFGAERYI